MFGQFDEVRKLETSLTKYSVKFNDFAESQRLHGTLFLNAVKQTFITLFVKVCEQTRLKLNISLSFEMCICFEDHQTS